MILLWFTLRVIHSVHTQFSEKLTILASGTHTHMCVTAGIIADLSENFAHVLSEWSPDEIQ